MTKEIIHPNVGLNIQCRWTASALNIGMKKKTNEIYCALNVRLELRMKLENVWTDDCLCVTVLYNNINWNELN